MVLDSGYFLKVLPAGFANGQIRTEVSERVQDDFQVFGLTRTVELPFTEMGKTEERQVRGEGLGGTSFSAPCLQPDRPFEHPRDVKEAVGYVCVDC